MAKQINMPIFELMTEVETCRFSLASKLNAANTIKFQKNNNQQSKFTQAANLTQNGPIVGWPHIYVLIWVQVI